MKRFLRRKDAEFNSEDEIEAQIINNKITMETSSGLKLEYKPGDLVIIFQEKGETKRKIGFMQREVFIKNFIEDEG